MVAACIAGVIVAAMTQIGERVVGMFNGIQF
jgi:hypothetical protein